jgi:hypothetical protein
MKNFIIESNGTALSNKTASALKTMLETIFDSSAEIMVGDVDSIVLYTNEMEPIGSFGSVPSEQTLRLYLSIA